MVQVYERLFVTNGDGCRNGDANFGVVHACKSPCHQQAVGYKGSLPKDHPNYLQLRRESDLFLNMIDPPLPLFPDELFITFLAFAQEVWAARKTLLIHCNQGESRAPSLALVFLAKRAHAISNESYATARQEFCVLFPDYNPGGGIQKYLTTQWKAIDNF